MEPVTDQTRKAVWDTLCDLEWNTRYYGAMADAYQRRHRWLRFALLTGVLIEAALFYAIATQGWPPYIGVAGGILLTVLTVWDAVADHAENAAMLRVTSFVCDDLNQEIGRLWRSIESGRTATPDAERELKAITDRWARATQRAMPETNDRLNRQTAADANRDIANRYAV